MDFTLKYYKTNYVVILVLAISFIVPYFKSYLDSINIYISIPGTSVIIMSTLYLYDKYLCLKIPFLLKVPIIQGRYSGVLISDFKNDDGKPTEIKIKIEISQKGSGIFIRQFNFNEKTNKYTNSTSLIEQLEVLQDDNLKLSFSYMNDGEATQEKLTKHDGFCILDIQNESLEISGIYFTNRNPLPTRGQIQAKFEQKKLLGRY